MKEGVCPVCNEPLDPDAHGNRIMHVECAYEHKKESQKEKYKIGNQAKLMIQKNEAVAALLYKMDPDKRGISHLQASEFGLKFNCPVTKRVHQNKTINMIDQYGYSIEENNHQTIITIYHESELH